jgi:hypothetical protein
LRPFRGIAGCGGCISARNAHRRPTAPRPR